MKTGSSNYHDWKLRCIGLYSIGMEEMLEGMIQLMGDRSDGRLMVV